MKTKSFHARLAMLLASFGLCTQTLAAETLRIYNWADYFGENTLADFEEETGIKVIYDNYDAAEVADAKLLAGNSGYDLVLHSGSSLPYLIEAGVLDKIDKSLIPNYGNYDSGLLKTMDPWDPGNQYSVPYMWGTTGVTYNMDMIRERLSDDAPLDSLDILFKPEYASKLADCGISVLESPSDIMTMALSYLGLDPNSTSKEDYAKVVELFQPVREYIRTFDNNTTLTALPNGEFCMVFNWSGDYATAITDAEESGIDIDLEFYVPESGSVAWFDVWMIPQDAPNKEAAHKFLEYLTRPEVIADITNEIWYGNANEAANELVEPEILGEPYVYPDQALMARLWTLAPQDQRTTRDFSRAWTKVKTGR